MADAITSTVRAVLFCNLVIVSLCEYVHAEAKQTPTLIGVQTSLTGEASTYGADIKNALIFARDKIAPGEYDFVFEDEKCDGKAAVTAAQKLISVDRVKYVLGIACNNALLASAPLYERAKVVVISATASSGDVADIGKYIFRLFPNDADAISVLFPFIAKRHTHLAVISELNEYPILMERATFAASKKSPSIRLSAEQFASGTTDFRTLIAKLRVRKVDAIYFNSSAEAPLITFTKQLRSLGWDVPLYTVYFGGSTVYLDAVGKDAEGVMYADLPNARDYMGPEGTKLLDEFIARFGNPVSFELVTSFAYESFRVLDLAIKSGVPVQDFLRNRDFEGSMLGKFRFDSFGRLDGLAFQMKTIRGGAPQVITDAKEE